MQLVLWCFFADKFGSCVAYGDSISHNPLLPLQICFWRNGSFASDHLCGSRLGPRRVLSCPRSQRIWKNCEWFERRFCRCRIGQGANGTLVEDREGTQHISPNSFHFFVASNSHLGYCHVLLHVSVSTSHFRA